MEWSDIRYAAKLRRENKRLFQYLIKKKNINPWTRVLVEEIIKLNISIIDDILK